MSIGIVGTSLIMLSFLLVYSLIIVFGVAFLFRKSPAVRNYVLLGIASIGLLMSYYYSLFGSVDTSTQSILLTVAFIVLIYRQRKLKRTNK